MTNLNPPKYTLVQHSGFGYAGDPGFEKGVEVRTINTVGELRLVQRSDGLVFHSWKEANDEEDRLNLEGPGWYPNVPGTFSRNKIDDLAIYQPPNRR